MRKLKRGRKLHRERNQRNALVKALMTALISSGKIKTTEAKAKEIRPKIEKMVTRAKVKSVTNIREIKKTFAENISKKLFDEVAPKYQNRAGGYTRITKLGARKSDGSKMAQIEFV